MTHAPVPSLSWPPISWPDLGGLLADLIAAAGAPVRLAARLLTRIEARDLGMEIRALETVLRQRLAGLIAEIAAFPPVAELCRRALARQQPEPTATPRPSGARATGRTPTPSFPDTPPVFRYLVHGPRTRADAPPAQVQRFSPARAETRSRTTEDTAVSALPLARRLFALEHAIAHPEDAAFDILHRHPHLVATALPAPTRLPAPAVFASAASPPSGPRNRHERRAQKKKDQATDRKKAKLKTRPGPLSRSRLVPPRPRHANEARADADRTTDNATPDTS